jgi:hypothetical protein
LRRSEVQLEASMIELDPENLELIHPTLETSDWLSTTHGHAVIGTGDAAFGVTARAGGIAGNSVSVAISAPSGTSTIVSVTGQTITVAPGIGAVVKEVVAAINVHLAASSLVRAGYKSTTNPNAVVATVPSVSLSGGAEGAKIGTIQRPRATSVSRR